MPSQSKPKIRWDQTQHTQVLRSHFCVIIFFLEKGNEPNVFGFGLLILELIFFESFEEENERRKRSKR